MVVIFLFILLQIVLAAVVITVLMRRLDRELILVALERAGNLRWSGASLPSDGIRVVSARKLPADLELRFRNILREKFPGMAVEFLVAPELRGGAVVQAGGAILDQSLATRWKHLFGGHHE